jgi:hypothetical protein
MAALIAAFLLPVACAYGSSSDRADPVKPGSKTIEVFTGNAYNFRTHLSIEQSGWPDISTNAKYQTRPFEEAPYYSIRFAKWREGGRATEIELLHHKIYLHNTTADVPRFDVTHGYNMLFLNQARMRNGVTYRVGGGLVIAHPENIVHGQELPLDEGIANSGFYLSGVAAQFAVGKRFRISGNLFATAEAKVTAAWARIKIVDGHATTPNLAVHGLIGIGYAF